MANDFHTELRTCECVSTTHFVLRSTHCQRSNAGTTVIADLKIR
ncbi:MAG: hypothetical protein QOH31_4539 [Verrucomicrobiota bacterium]|jgi:hypothetical protein